MLAAVDDSVFVSNYASHLLAAICTFPAANGLLGFQNSERATALPPSAGEMLSVADFARQLGVAKSTVYALCERGEIPHLRVSNAIRIPAEWGDLYLRELAVRGGGKS